MTPTPIDSPNHRPTDVLTKDKGKERRSLLQLVKGGYLFVGIRGGSMLPALQLSISSLLINQYFLQLF